MLKPTLAMTTVSSVSSGSVSMGSGVVESGGARKRPRDKAPPVYNKRRGCRAVGLQVAGDEQLRSEAMEEYQRDKRSMGDTSDSNLRTWCFYHEAWWRHTGNGMPVWPLTPEKIDAVGAVMKKSSYRSCYNYSNAAKDEHIAQGYEWTPALDRAMKLFNASTSRGIGPAKQNEPLDLDKLSQLDLGMESQFVGSPLGLPNLITLFVFFLLRDLEGAYAVIADLVFDNAKLLVRWWLPVSKTDPAAKGCHRTWGCLCATSSRCPYHAALSQVNFVTSRFPNHDPQCLPLFPNADGLPVSEQTMQQTVDHLATRIGAPITNEWGENLRGRHVWRVMGAVMLAELNVDMFRIQLLGRWGSDVVMRYARLAPIKHITEHVQELQSTSSLTEVIKELRESLADLSAKHAHLKQHIVEELREEMKAQEAIAVEATEDEEFVVNTKTGVHHRVRLRAGDPWLWSARCSWMFGRTGHRFTKTLTDKHDELCDKCFYRERKVLEQTACT